MATQKKKDGKKIGTSPTPTKLKKSLSTINLTSNQKQVPNYLKPTVSSSGVVDPPSKKQDTSATKPNINRRRSFDRPPSSSSSSSSTIHNKSPYTSLRSPSPVLSKVNSLPKPHIKKVIQSSSSTRANTTLKKTNIVIISGTNEEETNEKSEQVSTELDNCKKEDEAFSLSEIKEDVPAIEINNELVDFEVQNGEKPIICEDAKPNNLDDQKECDTDVNIEKIGETTIVMEVVNENRDEKKEEETYIEKEAITKEGDENVKEEDTTENTNELGGKDDVENIEENIEIASKEGERKDGISEEGNDKNNEVGNASMKEVQQQVHYNDVIEETKNKLLEKRKNKVKALVGAFETVISLQEPDT